MNFWHKRFQDENYVYGTEPNAFLADSQKKLQLSGDALAIAEGEGRNAVFLAEQGMNVTSWDYAESGLKKTQKLAETRHVSVKTELVDLNEASWNQDQWDEIVCIFGHFPEEFAPKNASGSKKSREARGLFRNGSVFDAPNPLQKRRAAGSRTFIYTGRIFANLFRLAYCPLFYGRSRSS